MARTRQNSAHAVCYDRTMQAVTTESQEPAWVMLAVAREPEVAEHWANCIEQQGIAVEIRIDDAVALTAGSSFLPAAGSGGHQLFAYPIFVPAESRAAAAAILVDQGWDGCFGDRRTQLSPGLVLRGALLATLVGVALAVLLLLRGG